MKFLEMNITERVKLFEDVIRKTKELKVQHGQIECPVCNGKLNFTVSTHNNHVSVACNSSGCIRFME
jgi:hypothetical protein